MADAPKMPLTCNSNKVLGKLVFFTLMMVLAPISTYYLSLSHVFDGKNTTAAAISAAIVANLVLAAFVVVALLEDKQDHDKQKKQ